MDFQGRPALRPRRQDHCEREERAAAQRIANKTEANRIAAEEAAKKAAEEAARKAAEEAAAAAEAEAEEAEDDEAGEE